MADYTQTNITNYEDNGRNIRKESWLDPSTGETWDTFNDVGSWKQPDKYVPYGEMRDPYAIANDQAQAQKTQKSAQKKKNKKSKKASYATVSDIRGSADGYSDQEKKMAQRQAVSADPRTQGADTPFTPSGDPKGDPTQQLNSALYDFSSPQFAMQNALKSSGINPWGANPFLQKYMAAAPGLAQAFLQQAATTGGLGPNSGNNSGNMFKDFLMGAIGGGGPTNIFATLQNGLSGLGGATDAARQYRDSLMGGTDMSQLNPFAGALNDVLRNPQAAAGGYLNMLTPGMNAPLGQATRNGVGAGLSNSLSSLYGDYVGNNSSNKDIYSYLLGL